MISTPLILLLFVSTFSGQIKNEVERAVSKARARHETVIENCETAPQPGLDCGRALQLQIVSYPPLARAAHITSSVDIQIFIGVDGRVIAAAVISGHPLLNPTALKAARKARFTPTILNGKPVRVVGKLHYEFHT